MEIYLMYIMFKILMIIINYLSYVEKKFYFFSYLNNSKKIKNEESTRVTIFK